MAFVINAFDKEAQDKGEWVEWNGAEFLIAFARNEDFQKAFIRITKPYKKQIERGTISNKLHEELLCEALAAAVLLDWKGVQFEEGGEETPYSKDLAKQALVLNPELFDFVSAHSTDMENYRKESIEATTKK